MSKRFYIYLLVLIPVFAWSQTDTTSTQGEIITGEVVIEKDKQIILPRADKLYQKGTLKSFDNDPLSIDFRINEPTLNWPPYKSDIPFTFVPGKYPGSEYPNYIRLGFGNYGSPLAEVGLFKKLGGFTTSSKLFYESFGKGPVNGSNSGNSTGYIDFSASYKHKNIELTPYIYYKNEHYRFYGHTNRINGSFNESAFKVGWDDFNIGLLFRGTSEDFHYEIRPDFRINTQKLKDGGSLSKESVIGGAGKLSYKIDEDFTTGFDLQGYSGSYDGGLTYDRSLFQLNPWIKYRKENITLNAGLNIATGNSGGTDNSGVYPKIFGQWDFADKWSLYGRFAGGVEWNGLNEMLNQTEFLDDSLTILNIETRAEFGGGLKGSPVKNMVIDASLTFGSIDNLPFIVPSASDSSRYSITYDGRSVDRLKFSGKLTYTPTNVSTYGASLTLFSYSTETLDRPWHLPTLEFQAYTSHNINEKLIASARVLSLSGIRAPADVSFGIQSLSSFVDLGLGVKYLFNKRASAFIDVDNLFNNEYERYIGYPVRGLTFKIGGQYRF